jgi:hypothetical protein
MLSNEVREESLITIFGIIVMIIGVIIIIFMYCNFLSNSVNNIHEHRVKIRKECKLIRKISGEYVTTPVAYGKGHVGFSTSYTSDKECYLCPNGIEECF